MSYEKVFKDNKWVDCGYIEFEYPFWVKYIPFKKLRERIKHYFRWESKNG